MTVSDIVSQWLEQNKMQKLLDEMTEHMMVNGTAVVRLYPDNDGKVVTEVVNPSDFIFTTGNVEPLAPTTKGRRYSAVWPDEAML